MAEVTVRVYGPLNDFLPAAHRQTAWRGQVDSHASVKDVIERLGVPHPEIDLVVVNGASVGFDYAIRDGDRIAVFPAFASLDISTVSRVRPAALDPIRFIADVHLGTLARRLRLAGLDTAYRRDAGDAEIAEQAVREGRVLLTRDRDLLKRRAVTHGYFVRETRPPRQFREVLRRFPAIDALPFSRCLRCNGVLHAVPKSAVASTLPPRTSQQIEEFTRCTDCGRVYWKGAHWERLKHALDVAREP